MQVAVDADTSHARVEVAFAQTPHYIHAYAYPKSWEALQKEWEIKLILIFGVEYKLYFHFFWFVCLFLLNSY